MCRHACPVFLATKMDSNTPRGHALLLSRIDEGCSEWTEDVIDKMYQCSQCGLCREICEFHWEEDTLVQVAREKIVGIGREPEIVKDIAKLFIGKGTAYTKQKKKLKFEKDFIRDRKADVLYFAGNTAIYEQPEIIEATAAILNSIDEDWTMLSNEGTAGVELYELGYIDKAKEAARSLAEKIVDINPSILITGCAHAYRAFKELYPQWGIKRLNNLKIYHITEYILKKIGDGNLELKRNSNLSNLSYHDPCQLGRRMGIYDAPRCLIEHVTGKKPIELFHNRNEAECCGAGSVMYLTHPNISSKVAERRINNALEEGAEILVTACPNCKNIFTKTNSNMRNNIKMIDIAELIASHIRKT